MFTISLLIQRTFRCKIRQNNKQIAPARQHFNRHYSALTRVAEKKTTDRTKVAASIQEAYTEARVN